MTVPARFETTDLYEAGYAMTRGLDLDRLDVHPGANGHPRVVFVFAGADAPEVARLCREGKAEANIDRLKMAAGHLRKRMWTAIKERTDYTAR